MRITRTLVAVWLVLPVSAFGQSEEDLTGRPVQEVFIERGDVLDAIPELIAQLEVPAVLELGYITAPRKGEEWSHARRWNEPVPPAPERLVREFEFRKGTIAKAFDAFCRMNSTFTWEETDGVLVLRRRENNSEFSNSVLNHGIGSFESNHERVQFPSYELRERMEEIIAHLPGKDQPNLWFFPPYLDTGEHHVYLPRTHSKYTVSVQKEDPTVREALVTLIAGQPNYFWITLHAEEWGIPARERFVVVHTNWSPQRREWSLDQLIDCLNPDHPELYGYRNLGVRIIDARRELKRRYHFHPGSVREALLREGTIERIIQNGTAKDPHGWHARRGLQTLFDLLDHRISQRVIQRVLAIEELDPHDGLDGSEQRVRLINTFPRPSHPDFQSIALPVWRRLAADDPDPAIRDNAETVLQLHRARVEYLKNYPNTYQGDQRKIP